MKRLVVCLLLSCVPAYAEFSHEEKQVTTHVADVVVSSARATKSLAVLARQADAGSYRFYAEALKRCSAPANGTVEALIRLMGTKLEYQTVPASKRVGDAIALFGNVARDIDLCNLALSRVPADVSEVQAVAEYMAQEHPVWLEGLSQHAFLSPRPPEWPFYVRRPPDMVVGLHGDFDAASASLAHGLRYIAFGMSQLADDWLRQPYVSGSEDDIFDFAINWSEAVTRMTEVMLRHSHMSLCDYMTRPTCDPDDPADQFERLFATLESTLDQAATHMRVMGSQHDDLEALGYSLSARSKLHLAAWLDTIDHWSWEALRFPCIEGFPSRCEEDK